MSHPLVDLYQWRTTYTFEGLEHRLNMWVVPETPGQNPGLTPGDYRIVRKDGTGDSIQTVQEEYYDVIQPFFTTDTVFSGYEIWEYAAGDTEGHFMTGGSLGGTGTITPPTPKIYAAQRIFTARTQTGRTIRISLEETATGVGLPVAWAAGAGTPPLVFGTWMLSGDNVQVDREGGYPIALMRRFDGQSEATFKRRYRPL